MLRTLLIPITLLCTLTTSYAQTPPPPTSPCVGVECLQSSTQNSQLAQDAQKIADQALKNYTDILANPSPLLKETISDTGAVKRRIDTIANETYSKDRDKILDFLGISAQNPAGLYYFVSFSMPIELIRSYVMDAIWTGGTLVFRGAKDNKNLAKFVTEDLRNLIQNKGQSANISIDPRLFDLLAINTTPTIAFVPDRSTLSCDLSTQQDFPYTPPNSPPNTPPTTLSYRTCNPADTSSFIKISGAVSTFYALDTFSTHFPTQIAAFKTAFAKSTAPVSKQKQQPPFSGNWDTLSIPTDPSIPIPPPPVSAPSLPQ